MCGPSSYLPLPQAATKKQKYEKICEKKMSTPVEVLCRVGGVCGGRRGDVRGGDYCYY